MFSGVLHVGQGRKLAKIQSRVFWENSPFFESRTHAENDGMVFERARRVSEESNVEQVGGRAQKKNIFSSVKK
jgi:hypothetical protein